MKEYAVRSLKSGDVLADFDTVEAALGFAYGWNHSHHPGAWTMDYAEVVDSILLAGESPASEPATLSEDNPERG